MTKDVTKMPRMSAKPELMETLRQFVGRTIGPLDLISGGNGHLVRGRFRRLEARAFIERVGVREVPYLPPQHLYTITPAGEAYLHEYDAGLLKPPKRPKGGAKRFPSQIRQKPQPLLLDECWPLPANYDWRVWMINADSTVETV